MRSLLGLTLAASLCCGPALAETHALILTISQYTSDMPGLPGVRHDIDNAREISRRMGIREANMRFYKDNELTYSGINKAFDELEQRVRQGDQVFVYYSGHGGRALVQDPNERCAEGLVATDGLLFFDFELEKRLKRLGEQASRLVVMIDACHSGGVTTRSVNKRSADLAGLRPKFAVRAGAQDSCSVPVNILSEHLRVASRSLGSGGNNYVYIAAAKANEVSFDHPKEGGLVTSAWLACINAGADTDRSGGLSVDELRLCAQNKLEQKLAGARDIKPSTITLAGNSRSVFALPEGAGKTGNKDAPASATLRDLFNSRDDRRVVSLAPAKPELKIGEDSLDFTVTSNQSGYLYVLMVGSDGKSFDLLFPNQIDRDNFVTAGQPLRLPRESWQITAQGPAGGNQLLAIVTDTPRDFSGLGMRPSGPFSALAVSRSTSRSLQALASGSQTSHCQSDTSATNPCSNAFGAALVTIREVK